MRKGKPITFLLEMLKSLKLFSFIKCLSDQVKFFSVTFSVQAFKVYRSNVTLWNYTTWSEMRDTLSMLTTWVDRDFRLSILVLTWTLFVWFCSWPQQRHENAALNSPRNFPAERPNDTKKKFNYEVSDLTIKDYADCESVWNSATWHLWQLAAVLANSP